MYQQFVGDLVSLKKSTLGGEQTVGLDRLLVGYRLRVKAKPNPDSGKKSSDWYLYPREGATHPPKKGPYFRTLPEVRAHFDTVEAAGAPATEGTAGLCVDAPMAPVGTEEAPELEAAAAEPPFPLEADAEVERTAQDEALDADDAALVSRCQSSIRDIQTECGTAYTSRTRYVFVEGDDVPPELTTVHEVGLLGQRLVGRLKLDPESVSEEELRKLVKDQLEASEKCLLRIKELKAETESLLRMKELEEQNAELGEEGQLVAAQSTRRTPPRAAAAAARSGIARSLAEESRPESAVDMENHEAAARSVVPKKPCPSCRKPTTLPRTRVFFGKCLVCYEGDELRTTSCGHPMCKACWDRM